jgi:hypothetical protein
MSERVEKAGASIRDFVDHQLRLGVAEASVPSELFHYTSPEGFIGIVDKRILWASDMLSLNDASEMTYPKKLILEAVDRSDIIPGSCKERFKVQVNEYMFRAGIPYVACFCEHQDLLSQWRGYGASGEGFAIGFNTRWLRSLEDEGFRLERVIYDPDAQTDLLVQFFKYVTTIIAQDTFSEDEIVDVWQRAGASLSSLAIIFKHPAFLEEREWRMVSEIEKRTERLPESFRRSGQRIVPYVKISIPHDPDPTCLAAPAITRVVRGPYFRGTETRGPYLLLVSRGFIVGATIEDSNIPLCS